MVSLCSGEGCGFQNDGGAAPRGHARQPRTARSLSEGDVALAWEAGDVDESFHARRPVTPALSLMILAAKYAPFLFLEGISITHELINQISRNDLILNQGDIGFIVARWVRSSTLTTGCLRTNLT